MEMDIGKVGQVLGLRQMSDEHQLEYARERTKYAPALFCTGVRTRSPDDVCFYVAGSFAVFIICSFTSSFVTQCVSGLCVRCQCVLCVNHNCLFQCFAIVLPNKSVEITVY